MSKLLKIPHSSIVNPQNGIYVGIMWGFNGNTIGKWRFSLWLCQQFAIEHGPVEIVSFPSYKMVDLSIVFCKRLPEGRDENGITVG